MAASPSWCTRAVTGLGAGDLRQFQGFVGIEVYNAANDILFSKGYSTIQWDNYSLASLERHDVHRNLTWGFAADDVHHFGPNEAGRGWVLVRTTDFSVPGLLTAMRAGHFYASQGPEIHDVRIADDKVTVECSPVRRISVMARRQPRTNPPRSGRRHAHRHRARAAPWSPRHVS